MQTKHELSERQVQAVNAALQKGQDVLIRSGADGIRLFAQSLKRIDLRKDGR